MKVLHVIPSLSKLKGGPTPITLNMVEALRKQGVDATILSTDDDDNGRLDVEINKWTTYEGLPVYFLSRFLFPIKDFIYCPGMKQWLANHLKEYDLIHTHYLFSYAPNVAARMAKKAGIPYIMTPYGMLAPWAISHQHHKKLFFNFHQKKLLKNAQGIHCSTITEIKNVQDYGVHENLFINPYIVKSNALIPDAKIELRKLYSITDSEVIILYLARLHQMKQPELLIQAIHRLKKEGLSVHLLMAGNGTDSYENYLKEKATSLKDQGAFTFAGFVSGRQKEILYQGSDIYVLPSHSENFGMTVCEASVSQTPVIITPGVQIADEMEKSGSGLIAENTVESIIQKIRMLINDSHLRKTMGENGRKWVLDAYNPEKVAGDLKQEYQRIINNFNIQYISILFFSTIL
ncbi:glycosyltransferase [soil metagenome]